MPWLWIWIVLVLCALVVLTLLAWRLWGQVKAFSRELGQAMRRLDELSASISSVSTLGEAEQALSDRSGPGAHRASARHNGSAPPVASRTGGV